MKKSNLYIFAYSALLAASYFLANAFKVSAAETTGYTPTTVELDNPLGTSSIMQIINNIIDYIIYISVPILTILVLVGGFQILTAKDSAANVTKGRKTIQYAAIGFAIIIISKGVALVVLKILGG